MLSFYDAASVAASPRAVSDPHLQQLLTGAVRHWEAAELLNLTHLVVVQPSDTEAAIVKEVGFSPLVNPLNWERFGSTSFAPFWDDLQKHGGWYELTLAVGNDGFAFVLFIQDTEGADSDLLALCRTYFEGAAPCTGS